jgi:methionyl-tRNA formyltransferase
MLRVAFAGTPDFAVPSLRALTGSNHQVVGVLTQPDRPAGRGRELRPSPVKEEAQRASLPLAQPAGLKTPEGRTALLDWQPDVLVVVAYGLILPPAALAIPRLGCLNVHASLLPRWRGAAPVQRAILAGDSRSGVSIMRMEAGLDTGPVYTQRPLELGGQETSQQLLETLSQLGASALLETLSAIEAGSVTPVVQSTEGVTYASKIDKAEAVIDWTRSAVHIARQVRAFNPWPVAATVWDGQPLRLWEATVIEGVLPDLAADAHPGQVLSLSSQGLQIQTGQGTLSIGRLQLAGRRVVSAREFAGGRSLAGAQFG